MENLLVYIDGKFCNKDEAKISVLDHGLLYGDGVFEGIRVYSKNVYKLQEHIDRLYESAKTIMLKIPMSKNNLMKAVVETVRRRGLDDAYIRLIVTRGEGTLGLDPRKCPNPSIIIIVDKIKLYPEETYQSGLELVTVATSRNFNNAISPQIKSLNYLNNILAKVEAINAGVLEAIMLTSDGFVIECTGDNIFIVKKNILITPPIYLGALEGVTRAVVINLARELGYQVKEEPINRHDVYISDEVFLTGTAAEVVPVNTVDGRVIGTGKPGKMTNEIRAAFKKTTTIEGTKV